MEKINTENKFHSVKQLRTDLNQIFGEIEEKVQILNELYNELAKTHQDKNYTIGLDSFHFQNKLIQMECENMKNLFNFIDNRIYCEYYKLHRMLFEFINKEIKDKVMVDKLLIAHKKYPLYKDLEPLKIYDFNITCEINNAIQHSIEELKTYLADKKTELMDQKKRMEMGINIHSIIHEQMYNNIILEERINMFENYLDTFISHHSKYFSRLTIKLKLMLGIVNEDFHLKNKRNKATIKQPVADALSVSSYYSSSSDSSTLPSPKLSLNDAEESHVRLLVGDMQATKEMQRELNTILQNILPAE
jgi:hypothetical protein